MSARSAAARPEAKGARRIVVKVGSGVLTRAGVLRPGVIGGIAAESAALFAAGREVVVVSSGAIAMGSRILGWDHPGRSIPEKQAAAAVGQISLSELWRKRLRGHGREAAQVLVTRVDLDDRERFLNARHTLLELLRLGVVPVVNENDTVATEEIRFGDNDNLSATVVNLVGADLLVILTDVNGLYAEPPGPKGPVGEPIDVVDTLTSEVEDAAAGSGSAFGRGGMITKLEAVRSAAASGAATVLANGLRKGTLTRVARGRTRGDAVPRRQPHRQPQALARLHGEAARPPAARRRRGARGARARPQPAARRHRHGRGTLRHRRRGRVRRRPGRRVRARARRIRGRRRPPHQGPAHEPDRLGC